MHKNREPGPPGSPLKGENALNTSSSGIQQKTKKEIIRRDLRMNWSVYLMALPVLIYFIIFNYIPMGGVIMAFQDFSIKKGILGSRWVGLDQFVRFFSSPYCGRLIVNTLLISFYGLIFSFPLPIVFALCLNEVRNKTFKKMTQTISYLPYFISVVVVVAILNDFCKSDGVLTKLAQSLGYQGGALISAPEWFRTLYIGSNMWQHLGYNSIIFISALAGIDPELYDAAKINGAGNFRILWQVVVPVSKSIIAVIVLFYAIQHWNSWFNASIYLRNRELYPLQLTLREIVLLASENGIIAEADGQDVEIYRPLIKYATIMVSVLPMMVVYPFVQKYFVSGVMIGSVKG